MNSRKYFGHCQVVEKNVDNFIDKLFFQLALVNENQQEGKRFAAARLLHGEWSDGFYRTLSLEKGVLLQEQMPPLPI